MSKTIKDNPYSTTQNRGLAMVSIPFDYMKEKILKNSDLTEETLSAKIKQKMNELSGLISKEGAAHIIANELGIKLIEANGDVKIKDVLAGMKGVNTAGEVQRIYEFREFQKETRSGKVQSVLISDETGIIRVVCWNDQTEKIKNLKEGDIIKITSAYAKENNERVELHLNDNSALVINPPGVTIDNARKIGQQQEGSAEYKRKTIKGLEPNDSNVELLATIVDVYDIRFFDSKQKPNEKNFVLNVMLDDGEGIVRTVLWSDTITKLLSKTKEEMLAYQSNNFNEVKHDLLGKIILVKGRANMNVSFNRMEFVCRDVDPNPDPKKELKEAPVEEQVPKEQPKPQQTVTDVDPKPVPEKDLEFSTADEVEEPKKNTSDDDDIIDIEDI